MSAADTRDFYSSQYKHYSDMFDSQLAGSGISFDNKHLVQDSALLHTWQTNGHYLHQVMLFYS